MKTTYYNPSDKSNPNGVDIDSSWPELARRIQSEMLESRGYRKMEDVGEPVPDSPFEASTYKILEPRDAKSPYIRKWTTRKTKFCLSMNKSMEFLNKAGVLDRFMKIVRGDSFVADWWFNDRTYVRGEEKSERILKLLGVSKPFFERMCLECFEIRQGS